MYDGSQNGTENQIQVGMEQEKNENDIKVGSVTGGPPQACFYLLETELKWMLARLLMNKNVVP